MIRQDALRLFLIAAVMFVAGGCAMGPYRVRGESLGPQPNAGSVLRSLRLDAALEDRVLALNPQRISGDDIRDTLAKTPAPRIILLHGGLYPAYLAMSSFAGFLIDMGYPQTSVRREDGVLDSVYSYSPYQDSAELAGLVAWYYEHDGMRPMLIGHSQGGVQVVKVLDDLAGVFASEIHVWNPVIDNAEERVTIVDPLTGAQRPVIGIKASYASAVGAGGAAFLLPNQWSMMHRLRKIPDTVDEFTGFSINVDLIAFSFPGARGASEYRSNGTASVRNVFLPSWYNHVVIPVTRQLAASDPMRDWLNAYLPDRSGEADALPPSPSINALWAAEVWFSIKKHWCLEVQQLIRARRAAAGQG
jgi:hypothetical protein